jgi:hypothetical protein
MKFTAILLVMISTGRFSGDVRSRRFCLTAARTILHLPAWAPRGAPFLLVAFRKLRHWIMTLFAGPIALYPRGRGQWESRAVCAVSFISGNGSASKESARSEIWDACRVFTLSDIPAFSGCPEGGALMQRVLIATLMALFFGLFSMPAVQAAPANGWAVGSAVKAISPLETIYYRRRYRRRRYRRYRRYRW